MREAISARSRSGLTPKEGIDRFISPPFWPVMIDEYPAAVKVHHLPITDEVEYYKESMFIGNIKVDMMEGTHPGGSTIYRLTYKGKSIVYATDFEHTPSGCEALSVFAADCDILLYDAQYTEEEYKKYQGYGHSTPEAGLRVAAEAGAARLIFIHHAPWRSDEALLNMEQNIAKNNKNATFAKIGDEILL